MSEFSSLNGYDVKDATARSVISEAQGDIQNLKSARQGIIGISREEDTNNYWVIYSPDGDHFYTCGEKLPSGLTTDASALFYLKGRYYYFGNHRYAFSTDLKNWSQVYEYPIDQSRREWANTVYYDEDTDTLYIYSAYQYMDGTVTPILGGQTYHFEIVCRTATIDDESGVITVDPTVHEIIRDDNDAFIDPFVIKDSKLGLVIAYKSDYRSIIMTQTMSDPLHVNNDIVECPVVGIEAPQLIESQGKLMCFFHMNTTAYFDGIDGTPPNHICGYFYVRFGDEITTEAQRGLIPIKSTVPLRHPGLCLCPEGGLSDIQALGVNTMRAVAGGNRPTVMGGLKNVGVYDNKRIINTPDIVYIFHGSRTVELCTALREEPFRFFIRSGSTITWKTGSWIQASKVGKSYTADRDEWMTLYPDARDALGGMFVPVDPE